MRGQFIKGAYEDRVGCVRGEFGAAQGKKKIKPRRKTVMGFDLMKKVNS